MAFLDNSGDIILDAVLTEVGRKRMANGNFKIAKFALGDDEINYELYNQGHRSGSAYYDLEILQTPVFEAQTSLNASINYGLLTLNNPSLLYLPTMKVNEKVQNSVMKVNNVYHVAVNDGRTYDALVTAFGGINGGGARKVLLDGDRGNKGIIIESGLDTAEIPATTSNKAQFITSQGLNQSNFEVIVDRDLISGILGPAQGTTFNNAGANGQEQININLVPNQVQKSQMGMPSPIGNGGAGSGKNKGQANIAAINNQVNFRVTDSVKDTSISAIAGPRAGMTALSFVVATLATEDYVKHGKVTQTVAGAAGTYRYIDTTVSIATPIGMIMQLPIRIIQKEA